jgi:hypothetical protein
MPSNTLASKVLSQQEQARIERLLKQLQLELTKQNTNNLHTQTLELVKLVEVLIKKD